MSAWLEHNLIQSLFSLAAGILVLLTTWLVGHSFTYRLSLRQKRREAQLSTLQQFYAAYGEFYVVWKLWNRLEADEEKTDERRWELYNRAAGAEANVEGLLVRLSCERRLNPEQVRTLGCFRQAFQQLRQSIRQRKPLAWGGADIPQYVAFKSLAVMVSRLLGEEWPKSKVTPHQARQRLMEVTAYEREADWVQYGSEWTPARDRDFVRSPR